MKESISDIDSCENQIHQFFHKKKIGSLLKKSNIKQSKGVASVSVFRLLFTLVLAAVNRIR